MKKLLLSLFAVFFALSVTACTKVPAGYEGVRVNNAGNGVQEQEAGEGFVFYNPFTSEVILYPLRDQDYQFMVQSRNDQARAFSIQDKDGMVIGLDVGLRFNVVPGQSSELVRRFGGDLRTIIGGRVRNSIFDALNNTSATMSAEEIYGEGRAAFLQSVEDSIRPELEAMGLTSVDLYWISELVLPPRVRERIEMKIEAEQEALLRENQIATATAEAQIRIEEARGIAESRLAVANAEADAIAAIGAAIAANPEYLRQQEVEKWNGVLPVYMGNNGPVPVLNVDR